MLVFGTLLATALEVAADIDATVVDMRFVKPLDARRVAELVQSHELLVTLEENSIAGGAGAAVSECLAALALTPAVLHLGIADAPMEHGTRDEVLRAANLDRAGVLDAIRARLHP
jgi:1-deoxy-D-xylulose-5-phosphate synthase